MVSLWPWKKDDSSTASFEKTLSSLSSKILKTQAQLDRARVSSRRARLLSTLYLSFAYLVYAIVALLVVGWKNMGVYEWTGMAGSPVLIYLVRTISSIIYDLRIDTLSTRLKDQQAERAKTIQKLKEATKYDSTLELLEKYGGGDGRPKGKKRNTDEAQDDGAQKSPGRTQRQNTGTPNRTHMPPPATANISRSHNVPHSHQGTPQQPIPSPNQGLDASAEFAPNAYDGPRQPPPMVGGQYEPVPAGLQNHWYDRIMDLLLGEDETAAKNRTVLICQRCRLVNGQAPPGTNSLAEVGTWKCMGCGATNGEVDEGKRIVKEVLGQRGVSADGADDDGDSSDLVEVQSEEGSGSSEEAAASIKGEETSGARKRKGIGKK